MIELIKISQAKMGNEEQYVVSARDLHEKLAVKRDFSNWIKGRIEKYGFLENEDFVKLTVRQNGRSGNHGLFDGSDKIEYFLTLDMAKELAMIENNKIGRSIRKYFIEVEKRYRELRKTEIDTSSFSSEKLLDVQKTLLGLETAIKILKVSEASKLLMTETIYRELGIKTDFLPKYSDEQHTYSLTHLLKKFGSKLSAQKVNQKLLEIGILEIKTRTSRQKKETSQMLLEIEFNNIE